MTTSALWDVPEACGCVLSRTEGHRCLPPFGSDTDSRPERQPYASQNVEITQPDTGEGS